MDHARSRQLTTVTSSPLREFPRGSFIRLSLLRRWPLPLGLSYRSSRVLQYGSLEIRNATCKQSEPAMRHARNKVYSVRYYGLNRFSTCVEALIDSGCSDFIFFPIVECSKYVSCELSRLRV